MLTRSNIRNYFRALPTICLSWVPTNTAKHRMAFTKSSPHAILESHGYITLLTKVPAWAYVSTGYSSEEYINLKMEDRKGPSYSSNCKNSFLFFYILQSLLSFLVEKMDLLTHVWKWLL